MSKIQEPWCVECGEDYAIGRLRLGYKTCLECGDRDARRLFLDRTRANLQAMTPNASAGSMEAVFAAVDAEGVVGE